MDTQDLTTTEDKQIIEYDSHWDNLSMTQQRFILLRSVYNKDNDVCRQLKITRQTVWQWKKDLHFAYCYDNLNLQLQSAIKKMLVANGILATNELNSILTSDIAPGDKIKAIRTAYDAVNVGNKRDGNNKNIQINVFSDVSLDLVNAERQKRKLPALIEIAE